MQWDFDNSVPADTAEEGANVPVGAASDSHELDGAQLVEPRLGNVSVRRSSRNHIATPDYTNGFVVDFNLVTLNSDDEEEDVQLPKTSLKSIIG